MAGIILENTRTSDIEVAFISTIQDSPYCDKWMKFVNNGPRTDRNQPWLSSAMTLADLPYAAPPSFDLDMMNIAESQTEGAQDELWLLQTSKITSTRKQRRTGSNGWEIIQKCKSYSLTIQ